MKFIIVVLITFGIGSALLSVMFGIMSFIAVLRLSVLKKELMSKYRVDLSDVGWDSFKTYKYIQNSEDCQDQAIEANKVIIIKLISVRNNFKINSAV
jgi:hypothetical protein